MAREPEATTATFAVWEAGAVPAAPLQVIVYVVALLSAPVLLLPLVPMLPDQLPEAMQLLALLDDQFRVEVEPLATLPGLALRVTVGLTTAAVTWIANAGSAALALPSLTLTTML